MRMFYRPALLVAALGMLASCSNSSTTPSNPGSSGNPNIASVTVPASDAYGQTLFDPHGVNIPVGGQVQFNNSDSIEHHPTADDGSWDGDLGANGGAFSKTFTTAGTYTYHCSIHPNMTGSIVVK
jgi:plastocyanin